MTLTLLWCCNPAALAPLSTVAPPLGSRTVVSRLQLEILALEVCVCVLTLSFILSRCCQKRGHAAAQSQDARTAARSEDEGGRALLQVVERPRDSDATQAVSGTDQKWTRHRFGQRGRRGQEVTLRREQQCDIPQKPHGEEARSHQSALQPSIHRCLTFLQRQ